MSTKPTPADFGPEYEQLLMRAYYGLQHQAGDFVVQFAEHKIASSVQAKFRAYVRSIKNTTMRPDLAYLIDNISTRIAGSALVFFRREDSVDAMAIRDALGLAPGFADGTASSGVIAPSTHLDTLKRIRERK